MNIENQKTNLTSGELETQSKFNEAVFVFTEALRDFQRELKIDEIDDQRIQDLRLFTKYLNRIVKKRLTKYS